LSSNYVIDKQTLTDNLTSLASIGALPEGGVTRLAFSPEEAELQRRVASWLTELGGQVRYDAIGNLIARWPGEDDSLPAVAFGSHLDSVPQGGNYDGIVGVVAAVAAVRTIRQHNLTTRHPLEVIAFVSEESSRFGVATLGSKVMAGLGDAKRWLSRTDAAGITMQAAASQRGARLTEIASARRQPEDFKAFLELHIEQGRVLEEADNKIGVVTAIAAPTRWQITIEGRADHSGATPMALRRDALAAAAEVILAVEHHGWTESPHQSVATIGVLSLKPGAMNVIPGQVELGLDVRGVDADSIQRVVNNIRHDLDSISRKRKVQIAVQELTADQPVELDETVISTIETVCEKLAVPYMLMPSGAGHDAMNMAKLTPTGLIFIPCKDGISHNPAEEASIDDIALGAEVLLHTILKLAHGNQGGE
jgi:N-carbamoyl-L-amino-acid hydrolase